MFGRKPQIIKYDPRAYQLFPDDSEAIFVKIKPEILDSKAKIEVPANYHAFIMKSGDYTDERRPGVTDIFLDKYEAKNFKRGQSVEILFAIKDKEATVKWEITGDSTTIFKDKDTNELVSFKYANGSFKVKITKVHDFHRAVVGASTIYRVEDFRKEALATVKSSFINEFFNTLEDNDIDYSSIARYRERISELVCKSLNKKIENHGFEFVVFDIDFLDLDYSKAKGITSDRNVKDEILSDRDSRIREIERENEERRFRHAEKMAAINAGVKIKKEIKTKKCPNCGRENPADYDFCIFCNEKLD